MPCQKIYCPKFQGGAKNLKGEIKKEGGYISTLLFFEQVENFFESIK